MHLEYLKKNGAVKTNVQVRYSTKKGKEMILLEIDTYTEEDMEEYGEFCLERRVIRMWVKYMV